MQFVTKVEVAVLGVEPDELFEQQEALRLPLRPAFSLLHHINKMPSHRALLLKPRCPHTHSHSLVHSLHHSSSLTLPPVLTKVVACSTTTDPPSSSFSLSPGLKAGIPL